MGTVARQVVFGVCMVLAFACVCYAWAVFKTHSGTNFWMVWVVFAVLFEALGGGFLFHWWDAMPRLIRGILVALICIAVVAFGTVEGCIVSKMSAQGKPGLDYVIVLGAQVHRARPVSYTHLTLPTIRLV